jgi:tetratricopeptide (TPR) repeat protein
LDFRGRQKQGSKCNSQTEQLEVCVLVVLFIATYFVSYLPFFISARYRVAIIPFLLLFASYGLYRIYQFIRERNLTASVYATIMVIGLYAIATKPFIPYESNIAFWHQDQGNAYLRTGQIDRAIEEYLESMRLKPDDYRTRVRLGSAFFCKQNYDEAIIHWSEAVRLMPDDHKTHALLGNAFLKQGNINKAILHWSEAARLNSDEPGVYYNLALAFHSKGMIEEAIKYYREALRLKPDYVEAKKNLRTALSQKKDSRHPKGN